jgi:hypothetical protein
MKFNNKLAIELGLDTQEILLFKKLNTISKIQDFLVKMPSNLEHDGESIKSVRESLKRNRAHCIEGALISALALWLHGEKPLILDLNANGDDDHVITLFKINNHWGAISKANRPQLRYRDPIYRNLHELTISYFHEYLNERGERRLVSYSRPFNLKSTKINWVTSEDDLWELDKILTNIKHYSILPKNRNFNTRKADPIELKSLELREFK